MTSTQQRGFVPERSTRSVVDTMLTAQQARTLWRTHRACNSQQLAEALLAVHSYIQYDAERGEDDAIIKDWRQLVPDATIRRLLIKTLEEDLNYKVIKDKERLIIEWRHVYVSSSSSTSSSESDSD
jgi:hypothetical protein